MPVLVTPRLNLIPTTREMMSTRLRASRFTLPCELAGGQADVEFPPSWPGDALERFPEEVAALRSPGDSPDGSYIAVLVEARVVIGGIGTKGAPDAAGEQEIGYGFGEEFWRRGYATETVAAFTRHLATLGVTVVRAETAVGNAASGRVLEKCGFARVGTGWDEEDGDLLLWARDVRGELPAAPQKSGRGGPANSTRST